MKRTRETVTERHLDRYGRGEMVFRKSAAEVGEVVTLSGLRAALRNAP
jgi:hypothetical protein